MYNIHLLPAAYGDSILIEYSDDNPHYILIDGGPYYNFDDWVKGLKGVTEEIREIELLVITHIDIDHIDGIVTLLKRDELPFKIKEVWFNGYNQVEEFSDLLAVLQGEYISILIDQKGLPHNTSFDGKAVVVENVENPSVIKLSGGFEINLLGPTQEALARLEKTWKKEMEELGDKNELKKRLDEDTRYDSDDDLLGDLSIEQLQKIKVIPDKTVPNGSSIAFIGTYKGKSCLFAADAPSDSLLQTIQPILDQNGEGKLKLDAWKIAHHGSKKSTIDRIMEKIECKNILVSSNGAKFGHPDQETIAKLIKHNGPGLKFYFNYRTEHNERWADTDLQKEYKFESFYPKSDDQPGISIRLV